MAYDPAAGTVRLYSHVEVRLALAGSDLALTAELAGRYASPAFEPWLSGRVLNYNQGRPPLQFEAQAAAGYLIITADAYRDAMRPFVDLQEQRGRTVTMTRLSDIPGGATTTAIKAYIQTAYDTWPLPPSYVLLVGDTDTLPGWNSVSAGEITDLYYVTMDGSSDYVPDIGRGRFPVRSADQTTILVDKYLSYAALGGSEPWLKTASFIATCDQYTVAEGSHNYVIQNYTQPGGYTGTFPNNPQPGGDKLYCITLSAGQADVQAALNQGRWVGIYSGHGSHTGWEFYSASDVRNLTHGEMLPFVASHACITGDFEETEVFGETWVLEPDGGALAFWGSSDSSYWGEDDVLERAAFDELFAEDGADLTGMTYAGLAATASSYPSSAQYYWETYNLLGDPAARILGEEPLATFTLNVNPAQLQVCAGAGATTSVRVGSKLGYAETVYLATGGLPAGVTAGFDPAFAPAPFTSELALDVAAGTAGGQHQVLVTADDHQGQALEAPLDLEIVAGAPTVPALISPAEGADNQRPTPVFTWAEALPAAGYRLQVARDPFFEELIVDLEGLPGTSYSPVAPLEGGRCHWWRVQADNVCGSSEWSEVRHFCTADLETAYYDDMESGGGDWDHAAGQGLDGWSLALEQGHSPDYAWHVPDDAWATDSWLANVEPFAVEEGMILTFWHRYRFEGSGWDGAVLEISVDGGPWADLGDHLALNGYNGSLRAHTVNPLEGRAAWIGDLDAWTQVEVDLNTFAGHEAQVRWRIGSDGSMGDEGWYVDDVRLSLPRPSHPAPLLAAVEPCLGTAGTETAIEIQGSGFIETPLAWLGDTRLLSVTQVSSTTLQAVVPADLEVGSHALHLVNGDCQEVALPAAFLVESLAPCQALELAAIEGPAGGLTGTPYTFTARAMPLTATLPLTFAWQVAGQPAEVHVVAGVEDSLVVSWSMVGMQTISVTVENGCGTAAAVHTVAIEVPGRRLYLPLVIRPGF
ncbi:MAG: C25 family cysteine peptidase [Anaerolineae bacterium]